MNATILILEPMAGEDADDITISAVFIGQDGDFITFVVQFSQVLFFLFLRWLENSVILPMG